MIGTNRIAILIGVGRYDDADKISSVASVPQNLGALRHLLHSWRFGLPRENVHIFDDHVLQDLKQDDVGSELRKILVPAPGKRDANRYDLVLIYYVGHGFFRNRKLYLGLPKTQHADPENSALSLDKITIALNNSDIPARVIILDCCYAGKKIDDFFEEVPGQTYVVASAGSRQAAAPEDHLYTTFTNSLVSILDQGMANEPVEIDVATLFNAVVSEIKRLRIEHPSIPLPEVHANLTERIPFAYNAYYPAYRGAANVGKWHDRVSALIDASRVSDDLPTADRHAIHRLLADIYSAAAQGILSQQVEALAETVTERLRQYEFVASQSWRLHQLLRDPTVPLRRLDDDSAVLRERRRELLGALGGLRHVLSDPLSALRTPSVADAALE